MAKNPTLHPGVYLSQAMAARGETAEQFAERSGIAVTDVESLLAGSGAVNLETAVKLHRALPDTSGAPFWLEMQERYDSSEAS